MSPVNQNDIAQATRKNILKDLCDTINLRIQDNNGRLPMGYMKSMVSNMQVVCPWLTRDVLNNELRRRKRLGDDSISCEPATLATTGVTDEADAAVPQNTRSKGGRPEGITDESKKNSEFAVIAAKNEISLTFTKDKKQAGKKRLARGHLKRLIADVKTRNGLGDDVHISEDCIRKRQKRGHLFIQSARRGPPSPLQAYESEFVQILVQMAKMRQPLSPSEAIAFINSTIDGTQIQSDLVAYKSTSSHGCSGTIGRGYWTGFMARNKHLLDSKRGAKYELDRAKWTTYANFHQMYAHIYAELVDAMLATILDSPEWQDLNGNRCEESEAFGCKVTHTLTHPEMCIVMDEVGGNTSQKGDGHIGGELLVCGKGMVPQKRVNIKDKHFTLLGLTSLNGDAVMCVIIFAGKREQAVVETGMDVFAPEEGDVRDEDFFKKNSGANKKFPGGPTCTFQGKQIPCLTRWSPKGSITAEILIDILSTLDHYGVFERSQGQKPFLLLDGHGSRFASSFLKYIMHPDHPWAVCIGVPYGTALWQVGDSSEQNGAYKIALARAKEDLIQKKTEKMMKLTIEPYEIIPLVNTAWAKLFARAVSNKKAIADCGWYPLNHDLLLNTTLRATMTDNQKQDELESDLSPKVVTIGPASTSTALVIHGSTPVFTSPSTALVPYTGTGDLAPYTGTGDPPRAPCFDAQYLLISPDEPREKLSFKSGKAAFCLDTIIRSEDMQIARQRIRREQSEGKTIEERIDEQKGAVTAGKLFNAGTCRIGQTVFDLVNKNTNNIKKAAEGKGRAAKAALLDKIQKAATIRQLGKQHESLTVKELLILIAPFKRDGDKKVPSKKAELIARLREWEARGAVEVEEEVAIVVANAATEIRNESNASTALLEDEPGMVEEV